MDAELVLVLNNAANGFGIGVLFASELFGINEANGRALDVPFAVCCWSNSWQNLGRLSSGDGVAPLTEVCSGVGLEVSDAGGGDAAQELEPFEVADPAEFVVAG